MHPDLEKLIQLQKVDSEIARLTAEINALPKHVKQIEAKLAKAQARVEKAKAAIKADEASKRRHEQDIQAQNDKIAKFREQSSSVKTNEQYKAFLGEISFAEVEIGKIEDKILEIMMAADARTAELKAAEAELKADIAEVEREKAEAHARTEVMSRQTKELNGQREGLRSGVEDSTLQHYDRVLRGRGTAIVQAIDQRCTGCQVLLRPQVYNDIISGNVVYSCETCSRLLYFVPDEEAIAKAAEEAAALAHSSEHAWMFVPGIGEGGVFAVFANSKGNASMKSYDALTGVFLEKRVEKNANYQRAFAEQLREARNLFVDEANLEEMYKEQLPPEILQDLQHQLPERPANPQATSPAE